MSFIGIIANSKNFESIKQYIYHQQKERAYQIIHINSKSIENIKHVKFDIIIITCPFENMLPQKQMVTKLCLEAKYLVLNADSTIPLEFLEKEKMTIITYGLNQKSTVTISSINEENALIALQRSFINIEGEEIEIGEKILKIDENYKLSPQDILVVVIIFLLFSEK